MEQNLIGRLPGNNLGGGAILAPAGGSTGPTLTSQSRPPRLNSDQSELDPPSDSDQSELTHPQPQL